MTQTLDPKILDCALSLEQAAGNESLAKELFEMLLVELPVLREKLRLALEAKDKEACWDHAHKLYGSTAYTGVPELKVAAQKMEDAVKQGDELLMTNYFDDIVNAIERLIETGQYALKQDWTK